MARKKLQSEQSQSENQAINVLIKETKVPRESQCGYKKKI